MVGAVWAVGAVLMVAFGPGPCRLAAQFMEADGGELHAVKRWVLWAGQAVLWPLALVWHARQAMYR